MIETLPSNDLLLRAAHGERTERTPVWMMRQAGRTDPVYVKLRDECGLPLQDMFRHPDLATEVSLLPRRLGVDALIFFQDILTPLSPMGAHFEFNPGPVLELPIRSSRQVEALRDFDPSQELGFVGEILNNLRQGPGKELPILGFAGAPLTLAFFLIEGRSPGQSPRIVHQIMRDDPMLMHRLLGKLTEMTVYYLDYQIECGAHAVQLFESVADMLTPEQYRIFAQPCQVNIFNSLRQDVPRILFAKEQSDVELMVKSGAEVISVGSCVDLAAARREFGNRVAFQGNVDNRILLEGSLEKIEQAVQDCIRAGEHSGHILNLNHGLFKDTPFEHVQHFVKVCRETRLD